MTNSFSEAIKKVSEPEAAEIVARIKEITKEQILLFAKLNQLIPLEQDYIWVEDRAGNVRPWRIYNGTDNQCDD